MEPINIHEYEKLAQSRIHPTAWDFYAGGSDDELTLRENRTAFEHIRLRPRVLVDVSNCDVRTKVLDIPLQMPIMVAPTSGHGMAHTEAECATARAAGASGTLMIVSSDATRSMEEIAHEATGPLWFQLYINTFKQAESYVRRAEAAGYSAIVLTVDMPRLSRRERDVRNDFKAYQGTHRPHVFSGHDQTEARVVKQAGGVISDREYIGHTLTWDTLNWLRSITSLPIILKGILTAEDALLAVEHGVAAIVVSNHGGRQLDTALPTIEALPEVVEAVAGGCEVYLDGGIRRGTDVLKALALGARAVLVGRPVLYGLIVNGQEGIEHVLQILKDELILAMALSGCPTLQSIPRSLVRYHL